jgi:hypothetical protein
MARSARGGKRSFATVYQGGWVAPKAAVIKSAGDRRADALFVAVAKYQAGSRGAITASAHPASRFG